MSNVLFEVRDGVGRVTLNRPASMNAVDGETEQELLRIWAAIEADRGVRVVVLTGAGDRAFCAGSDMKN
ncbi:MAG TPA: enoyl-CoA hydratase-related protein, partial [Casimicrobiaceae bacterium]